MGFLDGWRFCPRRGAPLTAASRRAECLACGFVTGEPRAGDDLVELRWFDPDDLPEPAELAFPTFVEILALRRGRHA